jgi:ubiquinone/menaquinone biosynthesis C-methylase UbiE
MTDWASYDAIATRYDRVWGGRFAAAAASLAERLPLPESATALDLGTGTGIVLGALGARAARLYACDRSLGMVRVARARVPPGRCLGADAARLPFRTGRFDAVTASFVLSHVAEHQAVLHEVRRVLKPGGAFAMTSWGTATDAPGEAWRALLAEAVAADLLEAVVRRVTPRESDLETKRGVEAALAGGGFVGVEVHEVDLDYSLTLDEFLADRALASTGRFARHLLGDPRWSEWISATREALSGRFGPALFCTRRILIGVGTRAA